MIQYTLALNIIDLVIFHIILIEILSKIDDGVHDWIYLESAQKEPNEGLVEDMLLFGELSSEESIRKEHYVVLETFMMIPNEMIELLLVIFCNVIVRSLLLVVGQGFRGSRVQRFGLVWSEHLGFKFDFFVDDLLHRSD